jgi:alcohol dehydrogenase class IV
MQLISPKFINYGPESTEEIDKILKKLKINKVYLLCDPILKEIKAVEKVTTILEDNDVEYTISTNVMAEPSVEKGNEIVEEVREDQPDLIIGLGGGSTLDLAKAASLIAPQKGSIENYLNLTGDMTLGEVKIPNILMPSTSGTGAEVTDIAVFSTGDSKDAITDPLMIADYAIVDPFYSYSVPPKVAAASGVDAFTHAIESYTSTDATPVTEMMAKEAMGKIYHNIREAVWDKKNHAAKDELSIGSMLAGMSFYNAGVGGVHALAYPLGGNFKIPHGESNAVLLPYVYEEILKSCSNKLAALAPIFSVVAEGKNNVEISREITDKLFDMVKEVGLPENLQHYGITSDDIELLTENALKQTRLLAKSPLELKEDEIKRIYTNALNGR